MADTPPSTSETDARVRANLSYLWSIAIISMVWYTLWEYGHILAVLTLLIGFITGTAATVLAVYFGAPIGQKKPDTAITQTGDSPINNVTTNPPAPVQ